MSENVVVTEPRPYIMNATSNTWTSGICDCFDDVHSTSSDAGECLCLTLLDAFGIIPSMTMALRVSVRQRYGIEGTVCNNCVYPSAAPALGVRWLEI